MSPKSPTTTTEVADGQQESPEEADAEADEAREEGQQARKGGLLMPSLRSFPTIVYRSPGPHAGTPINGASTSYESKGVADAEAFAAAVADGWWPTLVEAIDPSKRPVRDAVIVPQDLPPAAVIIEGAPVVAPVEAIEETPPPPSEPTLTASNKIPLESLSRADLKAMLEAAGVEFDGRASKETLIDLVVAAQKAV